MSATLLLDTCSNYGNLVMLILMTNFYELSISFFKYFYSFLIFLFLQLTLQTDWIIILIKSAYSVMIINANRTQKFHL